MLRSGVLVAVMLASMTVWLTQSRAGAERTVVLTVEALVTALALWRFAVGVRRFRAPTTHPLYAEFAPHGDPVAVAAEVEQACVCGKARELDGVVFTDRFIVRLGAFHGIARLDDIAWVYLKTTKHSVNFIPMGTTRSLEVFTYTGPARWTAMVLSADPAVYELIRAAATRARFGYSPDNEQWWAQTRINTSKSRRGRPRQAEGARAD